MTSLHQPLPSAGPARELLREKGQFWTPDWIADVMVAYVLQDEATDLFDPAVGAGAFFRSGRRVAACLNRQLTVRGMELDANALEEAARYGLSADDVRDVEVRDFLLHPPTTALRAIVANPPYIRHHRISREVKATLRAFATQLLGAPLDGRAGLHVYFFLRALQLLEQNGRLAFIMPADTCEGTFAPRLWQWVTTHFQLEHVIAFTPDATPFPTVDTNALVFMIKNAPPTDDFLWTLCARPGTNDLTRWALSHFTEYPDPHVATVQKRSLAEALQTGLSRPQSVDTASGVVLADLANVMRGIATGANEFFLMTRARAEELGIPEDYLLPAIGRTRDVDGAEITADRLDALERAGRPTQLLSLKRQPLETLPTALRSYLQQGEQLGLPQRALIAQRRPWYKMETREAPPFLFAYLGRRNARFIRNTAGVMPLTGFLCVYPRRREAPFVEQLWRILQHPQTIANLSRVGKSYGAGAIKVEPRSLDLLPIPVDALESSGILSLPAAKQLCLPV